MIVTLSSPDITFALQCFASKLRLDAKEKYTVARFDDTSAAVTVEKKHEEEIQQWSHAALHCGLVSMVNIYDVS